MSFYPEKIGKRFHAPENAGAIEDASAIGTEVNFTCGVSVKFYLDIDEDTSEIKAASFKTNACGYVIAIADFLSEKITAKKLTELHGLSDLENELEIEFGEISAERAHCANLCFDALSNTLAEYRTAKLSEWSGERVLICTCFGVAEETIDDIISNKKCKTVEEVGDDCNAGTGCGSCQPLIQEILDDFSRSKLP